MTTDGPCSLSTDVSSSQLTGPRSMTNSIKGVALLVQIPTSTYTMGLQSGAKYILRNVKGGTVIDQDSAKDDKTVHGWEAHGQNNQKWEAINKGDGWVFKNVNNNRYLSVDGELENGARVISSENETRWEVKRNDFEEDQGPDAYRLVIQGTKYSLDLADHGNPTPGTAVSIWGSWKGQNQVWKLERTD